MHTSSNGQCSCHFIFGPTAKFSQKEERDLGLIAEQRDLIFFDKKDMASDLNI